MTHSMLANDLLFHDPFFFPSSRQLTRTADDMQTMSRLGACDIEETETAHVFHIDAPGMKRDEVTIELKNSNILLVAGEREAKHEAGDVKEGHKWHRIERSYGKFSRAFQLPDNSDLDNISASFENGELKVTVPKSMSARHAKNRRIAIQ